MIIPRFLNKGDLIGVTAPSFGVTEDTDKIRFNSARSKLCSMGHDVVFTDDVFPSNIEEPCAPAEQRVSELNSLLEDDAVGCIISAKGGDYQIDMLPLMDWDLLKRHPKWMQGYSDNTVILFKATVEYDIATIYGSNFGDFGMDPWHRSVIENLDFLKGNLNIQRSFDFHESGFKDRITGLEPISDDEKTFWNCPSGDISFKGRLIGGCMDVLEWYHAKDRVDVGRFIDQYSKDGIIWFMETYDMDEKRIRKMFKGMKKDGWFDGSSGFVLGRPLFYSGSSYEGTIIDVLSDLDVPVVFGADVGHIAPRMIFVNGSNARFDIQGGSCSMRYEMGSPF